MRRKRKFSLILPRISRIRGLWLKWKSAPLLDCGKKEKGEKERRKKKKRRASGGGHRGRDGYEKIGVGKGGEPHGAEGERTDGGAGATRSVGVGAN